jgi:hypothetical protein
MRLYSGTTKSLIEDSTYNRIATKLKDAFFLEFRHQPAVAEVNSWNNSLRAVSQVFQTASLLDHGVLLELQLPLTSKRLDCLVTGYDRKKPPNAVIIELKQWSGCKGASGKNEVATFVGGNIRDVLHPSVQVGQYTPGAALEFTASLAVGIVNIEGIVKKKDKPLAGIMVALVPKDPEAHIELFRRDQSDFDGTFLLQGVIPGSYTIVAVEDAWGFEWLQPGVLARYVQHGQNLTVGDLMRGTVHLPDPVEVQPH